MLSTVLACLIIGIMDGDTLTARCGDPGQYQILRVRLAAIDAPELAQPFGQKSREALADLCYQQPAKVNALRLDRYKRTVATVECQGIDSGTQQVRTGMAWVYPQYATGFEELFFLEDVAQEAGAGLWVDKGAVQPWKWRAGVRIGSPN